MEILASSEMGLKRAIELLRDGGIGGLPTDTVYGLAARIDMESALVKIFKAKGRSQGQPIPVLIADRSQLLHVSREIPPLAWRLAERFWPGGLTLVLQKSPQISGLISAGSDKVAVRLPAHSVPVSLIRGLGIPITGTSANRSSQPPALTGAEVIAQLGDELDFIIDGGRCPGGRESTVIDLTQEPPRILREGAIAQADIERFLSICL